MDLPEPPAPASSMTRAPVNGLKLMLAMLVVFVLLVIYGQWEVSRRPITVKATIIPAPDVSPSPAPNHD